MKKVIIYALVSLFFPFCCCTDNVKEILQKIPSEEIEVLERLFYILMHNNHASYTLFGDKPVSLAGDFTVTPLGNTMCKMRSGGVFWEKWSIWKKYESLFPMKRFLFLETPTSICPQDKTKTIVFINKKSFLETVTRHLDLFRKFLGAKITPEGLLAEMERTQDFFSTLQRNEWLIGILLGYGYHNAHLFFQRDKPLFFTKAKQLPKFPHKVPEPNKPFASLEEETQSYFEKLQPFGDYSYSPLIAKSVHFVAEKGHPETIQLEEKYRQWREKISLIYAQGNILEVSLSALMHE